MWGGEWAYVIHKDGQFHLRSDKNYPTRQKAIGAARGHCSYLRNRNNKKPRRKW